MITQWYTDLYFDQILEYLVEWRRFFIYLFFPCKITSTIDRQWINWSYPAYPFISVFLWSFHWFLIPPIYEVYLMSFKLVFSFCVRILIWKRKKLIGKLPKNKVKWDTSYLSLDVYNVEICSWSPWCKHVCCALLLTLTWSLLEAYFRIQILFQAVAISLHWLYKDILWISSSNKVVYNLYLIR